LYPPSRKGRAPTAAGPFGNGRHVTHQLRQLPPEALSVHFHPFSSIFVHFLHFSPAAENGGAVVRTASAAADIVMRATLHQCARDT
ncbi:MAG TPA: hypothetical protein VEC60_12600, partial [Reyranella sp.]|nr:hypothetical protein [Reyranella sp.]